MFLKKIKIKNIRCISDIEIDLESRATANHSLVLLGNNGVGKSTILKCIALGLCDAGGASALLADMYGSLVRNGEKKGVIELTLNQGTKNYTIKTTVKASNEDEDIEEIEKVTTPKTRFPWSDVFMCGYGPSRILRGTNSYDQYALADAVYTLFNYGWKLQNPELVVRRHGYNNKAAEKAILKQLANILMMKPNALRMSRTGITVREDHNKSEINFGALADGHQSTLNWVIDLIGWTYLNRRKNPSGIVLLDEVENHLHPMWQRHIMRLLSNAFPRIQFIATSHSPICAVGMTDKTDRGFKVGESHVLMREGSHVECCELTSLEGKSYDRVLESIAFGVMSIGNEFESALSHYRSLQRSGVRGQSLKKALSAIEQISPFKAEQEHQAELDRELAELLKARKKSTKKKKVKRKK